MDLLCVLLVFFIGRRLYDARVGLVGALLLSLTVLNIQQSHFFTVDTSTTLFVTLALYLAVRVAQGEWMGLHRPAGRRLLAWPYRPRSACSAFLAVIGLAYALRIVAQWQRPGAPGPRHRGRPLSRARTCAGALGQWFLSVRVEPKPLAAPNPAESPLLAGAAGGLLRASSLLLVAPCSSSAWCSRRPSWGRASSDFSINPKWREDMKLYPEARQRQDRLSAQPPVGRTRSRLVHVEEHGAVGPGPAAGPCACGPAGR